MKSVMDRFSQLFLVSAALICSFPAHAGYAFTKITYAHGTVITQLWGINNDGLIVGQALYEDPNAPTVNFLYDAREMVFTVLQPVPNESTGLLGINDPGVTVGAAFTATGMETGLIRDAKGKFSTFLHAGPMENTEGRAVSDSGLVTGFAYDDADENTVGFIYNPKQNTFVDFLASANTIAQGINVHGQVVGNVFLLAGGAYPSSPQGLYGFVRDSGGAVTFFRVNGINTRGRGINDSSQITGFIRAPGDGALASGFVGSLTGGYQPLNVPNATETFPQAINNGGQIVGYTDTDGFIATLIATNKDQCKGGGWESLSRADGTFFKNQGDCIQYVNTGK